MVTAGELRLAGDLTPTGRFQFTCGSLVRGRWRRAIKAAAFTYGVQLEIEEDRGWFESLFTCTATGQGEHVRLFLEAVQETFLRAQAEGR